jgi:hypothetical protein
VPRQPFRSVVPAAPDRHIDIGVHAIGRRPGLETIVCKCLIAWPSIEAEMALVLGQLLGAQHAPALAVFQSLRRSSIQRDVISEAAAVALTDDADRELLTAILNVHKAVEAERNAFAHGHFGCCNTFPDGLLWMSTENYIRFRASRTLAIDVPPYGEKEHAAMLATIFVYRKDDLEKIYADFEDQATIWFLMTNYLKLVSNGEAIRHAELYRQLCDRPRIAQELDRLRRGKTPPTQT